MRWILFLLLFMSLGFAYTAPTYDSVNLTLSDDYIAPTYDSVNLTLGVVIPVDTCSNCDGTADCYWDCSDDCNITSNINNGGYNIIINQSTSGTHTTTITANITNYGNVTISGYDLSNICNVILQSGGGFR